MEKTPLRATFSARIDMSAPCLIFEDDLVFLFCWNRLPGSSRDQRYLLWLFRRWTSPCSFLSLTLRLLQGIFRLQVQLDQSAESIFQSSDLRFALAYEFLATLEFFEKFKRDLKLER